MYGKKHTHSYLVLKGVIYKVKKNHENALQLCVCLLVTKGEAYSSALANK